MEWLSIVKTSIEIAFYIVTGSMVVYGISSWRRELGGRNKYELSKTIISGALIIRDAIYHTCSPFMSSAEYKQRNKKESENPIEEEIKDSFYAYSKRYEAITNALSDLYPSVLEIETLFGKDTRKKVDTLYTLANKLWWAIETHHRDNLDEIMKCLPEKKPNQRHIQRKNIIYGEYPELSDSEEDRKIKDDGGFREDLESAVDDIEKYFSKYIR